MSIWRVLVPPRFTWACHVCHTWRAASYTTKGGQRMVRDHEWQAHRRGSGGTQ